MQTEISPIAATKPKRGDVPGESDLLAVPDAAAYLGIQTGTLRNWLSVRRLPYVKIGRLTRVSRRALDHFIAAHTVTARDE
jgi:excisionase family DNA binding protein